LRRSVESNWTLVIELRRLRKTGNRLSFPESRLRSERRPAGIYVTSFSGCEGK